MAARSRFLRNGSMPPSARYNTDSYRSGSVSRSARSTSVAPVRSSYRESSITPARASSVAPRRAVSVAPRRAVSVAPYRASSVAPYRASSVAPYRASSVTPYRASSVAPMRAPPVVSYYRAGSLAPQPSSSFRSSSVAPRNSFKLDTNIPTRQFGSRLAYQKTETDVKPAIYDEFYGMTYVPSGGRDSWSAYRISDETLDDNDELVYQSAKKDHEVMKRINKQIVNTLNSYKPRSVVEPGVYRAPTPRVAVTCSSVDDGSKLLTSKEKLLAKESFDFSRPAAYKSLKDRLKEARFSMDKTKSMMGRHTEPDAEMSKINAEVQAIKNKRNLRAKSLAY